MCGAVVCHVIWCLNFGWFVFFITEFSFDRLAGTGTN